VLGDGSDTKNDREDRRESSQNFEDDHGSEPRTKEVAVAKVIEFYVPNNFRKALKWVPELQRGKILEFCTQTKKSA
jgi:hypothetical protein